MEDRNTEATIYVGNLDERVNDALLWELMLQAGPVVSVHLPKDRVTTSHQGFGFAEFLTERDAEYAVKVMNSVRMFGKPIRVNKASADKKQELDIGADLFIGNLDPLVDEKLLYDTFSAFGSLMKFPHLVRDESHNSKGYGFVSFTSFEASDSAIEALNNQFLANKPISVMYAFKKEGKGERHGDHVERLLATQAQRNNYIISPVLAVNGPAADGGGDAVAIGMPTAPLPAGFSRAVVSAVPPPPGAAPPHHGTVGIPPGYPPAYSR